MSPVPDNNAYIDQPSAASVPIEISVSIVAAPCRRFDHAARWNGHAPQATTGTVRANESQCQYANCSAGTIAIATTGTVSANEINNRRLNGSPGFSSAAVAASDRCAW